jgi:hypothetical protein
VNGSGDWSGSQFAVVAPNACRDVPTVSLATVVTLQNGDAVTRSVTVCPEEIVPAAEV